MSRERFAATSLKKSQQRRYQVDKRTADRGFPRARGLLTSENVRNSTAGFSWTKQSEEAAQLIATGELGHGAVASRIGIDERTLYRWRKHPDFAARVDGLVADFREAIRRRAIGWVESRVDRLNRDWLKLQRIIDERGADPDMASVPGGKTGLVLRKLKSIGSGEKTVIVKEYEIDAAILKELRALEKQAAIELGQWGAKREMIGGLAEIHDLVNAYRDPVGSVGQSGDVGDRPATPVSGE